MKNLAFRLLALYRNIKLLLLRLRGKTLEDHHADRIVSGKAWNEFCDSLKAAGASLHFGNAPRDPFNQAEGYRYLTRLVRASLEAFLEYADPAFPELRRMVHETVKMGADNPDNYYENAKISGAYEYKISGKRNTVHYLGFFTQMGDYGKTGGLEPSGALEAQNMHIEKDGSFEIIVSCQKPANGKNWLPMQPESSMLMVRQTFLDRANEKIADLKIENISQATFAPAQLTPKMMDESLTGASAFVAGASFIFSKWANGFQKHSNQLPLFDPAISNAAGGVNNIAYYHSHWQLAEDEVLIIEAMPPKCTHWNFQLNNYWMESLDYRYFQVHVNKHSAKYLPDGSVRIVVAHEDPGVENWIRTVGHRNGTMCFRWVDADVAVEPKTRVVKIGEISK